ncbi:hypothetical protein H2200_011777 [Cladophialophora chaetospira]|uniref:Fe2OG dioxygenase domain-containing protein n=1 Tax=Cladophialophora chaetospira TaxID=386627 RepID=A0AA39CCV2_9EURO|nr:hypothetical protein H2200_011777 [Cladophialophora chaetospira]
MWKSYEQRLQATAFSSTILTLPRDQNSLAEISFFNTTATQDQFPESSEAMQNAPPPVVDFSPWTSGASLDQRLQIGRKLVETCHQKGFAYISNHGVAPSLVEEAFAWSKKFFDLPIEDKMQVKRGEDSVAFRGYNVLGVQKVPLALQVRGGDPSIKGFSPDFNETFDLGSDENIEQPNKWLPEHVLPGFREFSTKFYGECWKATQNILRALAIGLGIEDENLIERLHSYPLNSLSFKHYPPVLLSELDRNEKKRLGAHSDMTSVTLLFQDNCGGLEFEIPGRRGEFVPIKPIPGTLVMNVGDALMRWSNGKPTLFHHSPQVRIISVLKLQPDYLQSAIHRVQSPPRDPTNGPGQITRRRYSIPYFVLPKPDKTLECLPCCSNETNPPKYPPTTYKELATGYGKLFYPEADVYSTSKD